MRNHLMAVALCWSLSVAAVGLTQIADPSDVAPCRGYAGPGGPCNTGPGGGLNSGPGGGLNSGPGGGLYPGPGGGMYPGPGGGLYPGPGGGLYPGPGAGIYPGPPNEDGCGVRGAHVLPACWAKNWMQQHCPPSSPCRTGGESVDLVLGSGKVRSPPLI